MIGVPSFAKKGIPFFLPIFLFFLTGIAAQDAVAPPVAYGPFTLGSDKGTVNQAITAHYSKYENIIDTVNNTYCLVIDKKAMGLIYLFFDEDQRLYRIRVLLGQRRDLSYIKGLLSHLEEKYGTDKKSWVPENRTYRKATRWSVKNGSCLVELWENINGYMEILYRDMEREKKFFPLLKEKLYGPIAGMVHREGGKVTLRYRELVLGMKKPDIVAILAVKFPQYRPGEKAHTCKCPNDNRVVMVLDKTRDERGSFSEIALFFDTADVLYEIVLMKTGVEQQYIIDLINHLRPLHSEPAYISGDHIIARWTFEGDFLCTASYSDMAVISLLDSSLMKKCSREMDKQRYRDY